MTVTEIQQKKSTLDRQLARKPKLGFLGVGWIGKHRLEAIMQSGVAEVVGLCDPLATDTVRYCRDHDIKNVNDYDSLLDEDLDGVVIATPNALHKHQTCQALMDGKAVFCQKPLACTMSDTIQVIETARKHDCLLMTDLSYRYTQGMRKIKVLMDSGELGDIFAAHLTFHSAYGPEKSWHYDRSLSGGGCVMDLGIHLIDILYWLFPDIAIGKYSSNLYAKGKPLAQQENQVEDYAMAHLTFSNGMAAQLCCSWNLPAGKDAIIELNFYGTKGGATFRNVNGSYYDFKAEYYKGTTRQILSLPPDDWGGKAAVQWASLLSQKNEYQEETDNYIKTAMTLNLIYAR